MVSVLKQDEIEQAIKKKGFRQSNNDHRYYVLYVDGKKEAGTFMSHGKNQDISAPILNAMAKELGISKEDFIDLIKCPRSAEEYVIKKRERLAERLKLLKHG
jgi:hypothetical protein